MSLSTPTPLEQLETARLLLEGAQRVERDARRSLSVAEDLRQEAEDRLAAARVAAGDIPPRIRIATPFDLDMALRARHGLEFGGTVSVDEDRPGPGFMPVLIGLLRYWIPMPTYRAWDDARRAEREARRYKEAGK